MDMKDAILKFKDLPAKVFDRVQVNPLALFGSMFFDEGSIRGNYRRRAINHCVKEKISFKSDCNYLHELVSRFVKVECPNCGKMIETNGSLGNGQSYSETFLCKHCDTAITLTFPANGFEVQFPEDQRP